MAFTALDTAYLLDDRSVAELIEMEKSGSAPVSEENFSSRMASADRLAQLSTLLASARTS